MVQTPQLTQTPNHRTMENHDQRTMELTLPSYTITSQTIRTLHSLISQIQVPQIRGPWRGPQTIQNHGLLPHPLLQCNTNHLARSHYFSITFPHTNTILSISTKLHPFTHQKAIPLGHQRHCNPTFGRCPPNRKERLFVWQNHPHLPQHHLVQTSQGCCHGYQSDHSTSLAPGHGAITYATHLSKAPPILEFSTTSQPQCPFHSL